MERKKKALKHCELSISVPTRTMAEAHYIAEEVGVSSIGERGVEGMSFG